MIYTNGYYLAYVLSEYSRDELINFVPPSFGRVICHHVTIAFRLDQTMCDIITDVIGKHPTVYATAHLKGDHIECFEVEINGAKHLEVNGQQYHVTHSLEAPAKPVDSSKMLGATPAISNQIITFSPKILLQGTVELVRK